MRTRAGGGTTAAAVHRPGVGGAAENGAAAANNKRKLEALKLGPAASKVKKQRAALGEITNVSSRKSSRTLSYP